MKTVKSVNMGHWLLLPNGLDIKVRNYDRLAQVKCGMVTAVLEDSIIKAIGGSLFALLKAGPFAQMRLFFSLLVGNDGMACAGVLISAGDNLFEFIPAGCTHTGVTTSTIAGLGPQLGTVKDNCETHALLADSPGSCAGVDQRDVTRSPGVGRDIGAPEGVWGNCNVDILVGAGDVSALTLEIFDGDGSNPISVPGSDVVGDSSGCNVNQDGAIDAEDASCLVQINLEEADAWGT